MGRYRIDPERSQVWIEGRSSLHPIHSTSTGLEGFVELVFDPDGVVDPEAALSGKLSLPADRLSSGNRMEDRELQKRIDIRRYPTIEGVLDQVRHDGANGNYEVAGEVTFRGVSRRYEDRMEIENLGDQTVRMAGESRFDIRDFGMQPPRMLMLKVEPEVDIRVEIFAQEEA